MNYPPISSRKCYQPSQCMHIVSVMITGYALQCNNKSCHKTSPRNPLQGAATWRIYCHDPVTIIHLFWLLHKDSYNHFRIIFLKLGRLRENGYSYLYVTFLYVCKFVCNLITYKLTNTSDQQQYLPYSVSTKTKPNTVQRSVVKPQLNALIFGREI